MTRDDMKRCYAATRGQLPRLHLVDGQWLCMARSCVGVGEAMAQAFKDWTEHTVRLDRPEGWLCNVS